MKRGWKISLFCIASIFFNLITTFLVFDTFNIPLFFDTVFTVAIIFYLGLVPGLAVGILFIVVAHYLEREQTDKIDDNNQSCHPAYDILAVFQSEFFHPNDSHLCRSM